MSVRIINADVMEGLRQLPDESVHCVVTSPPYWGLRDYGVDGQIGLEATPDEFVARMVEVFREVRRVLRNDGTCWVNLGDSYNNRTKVRSTSHQPALNGFEDDNWAERAARGGVRMSHGMGVKEKDLVGAPWMVAFALRTDGWYLRSDVIWHKPNPMPESVTDRPTKSHEYVFLLTKSERYFYDAEAIKEGAIYSPDRTTEVERAKGYYGGKWAAPSEGSRNDGAFKAIRETRNKRSVWTIATHPFPEAHFATFPPELPEICILAGTSQKGCCAKCGAPWGRETERNGADMEARYARGEPSRHGTNGAAASGASNVGAFSGSVRTTGWSPSCSCNADVKPCTVLDPFSGAGTTALVADRLQRNAIGIELNPTYAAMSERRINGDRGALLDLMEAAQ
jgi:DNA modification methylase